MTTLGLPSIALLALLAGPLGAQEGDRPTLAVLGLQGAFQMPRSATQGPSSARPLGELLVQRLDVAFLATGRFRVLERHQLKAVLREGAYQQKGLVDDATAVTLGRQLGAQFVLVGSYSGTMAHAADVQEHLFGKETREEFYPARLEVRLRLVRTEDGSIRDPMILAASARDPQASRAFDRLMDDFARVLDHELAVRYPLAGYVVRLLPGGEVLADFGRDRGVAPGDVFLAVEAGPDAVHPVTGKEVPGERRVVGELVVTEAGPESATLRPVAGGPVLKPGCRLERKPR